MSQGMKSENPKYTSMAAKDRIHKVFSIYAEKSSVSGLSFIIGSKYPIVRILWALLLVFAVFALTAHLILLFLQYYAYDKHTVTSFNFSTLLFPAVTFCNVNPIRMSKIHLAHQHLQELVNHYNPKSLVKEQEGAGQESLESTTTSFESSSTQSTHEDEYDDEGDFVIDITDHMRGNHGKWGVMDTGNDGSNTEHNEEEKESPKSRFHWVKQEFKALYAGQNVSVRKEIGHSLKDLLIHCSFGGRLCKHSDFKFFTSDDYGNCYTLNKNNLKVTKDGPTSGLELILYIQREDHIRGFTTSKGAQVVVHEFGTIPSPSDEGFSIAAGTHTMIGLRMLEINRLGKPYGDCISEEEAKQLLDPHLKYTREICQKICQMMWIKEQCGCTELSYWNIRNDSFEQPCNTLNYTLCAEEMQSTIAEAQDEHCYCPNPCREKRYVTSLSSRLWPDEDYSAILVNGICRKQKSGHECESLKKKHRNTLREEFVKLSIYYEDLNYEKIEEVPNYKLINLLSDIGGTIGLWIGLSLLSLVEIVHLLSSFLFTTCLVRSKQYFKKPDVNEKKASPPVA